MNEKPTLDTLLRQWPAEKLPADFTDKVMAMINTLPRRQARRLTPWAIIGCCAGGIALAILAVWGGNHFFGWPVIDLAEVGQTALTSFTRGIADFAAKCTDFKLSPVIWSGLLSGMFLLLVDAFIRKHKKQKPLNEEVQQAH